MQPALLMLWQAAGRFWSQLEQEQDSPLPTGDGPAAPSRSDKILPGESSTPSHAHQHSCVHISHHREITSIVLQTPCR